MTVPMNRKSLWMRFLFAQALACGLAIPALAQPVVLELFTSQGCSSCPPAEALLQKLAAAHPADVTLEYHVDYWNNLGWPDPYSSQAFTARQRGYSTTGNVFTPEIKVQGLIATVGSHAAEVTAAIAHAPALFPAKATPQANGGWLLALPATANPVQADVLLLTVQDAVQTPIQHGENSGLNASEHNVVRQMQRVAGWLGKAGNILLPALKLETGQHAVVLVQQTNQGRILAAQNLSR